MDPRPQNYCSFYVEEPFIEYKVNATSTPDYCYYNLLKTWRRGDRTFNYYDAHCLTYNLRDGRPFDEAKQIIHDRIDRSKNIILILTSYTRETDVMNEELDYGINVKGKPLLVVYPELTMEEIIETDGKVSDKARKLWSAVPRLDKLVDIVYAQHVPFNKIMLQRSFLSVDEWISNHQ